MGLWSLAPVQAAPHAGAAFWLVTFYSSTAPAEELDLEALQLGQGPDRGGFAEKVSLIEKARASGVAETESMVVQQLPMPSLAALLSDDDHALCLCARPLIALTALSTNGTGDGLAAGS